MALETNSAREYLIKERQFIENYFFDPVYGGAYFSVGEQGQVLNPSKDATYQTNVILFLAGVDSEVPDPQTAKYITSAASFIVDHLYPGPYGVGTWWSSTDRSGASGVWPGWLAPSEAYMSYGLLWAYKITGNHTYLDVAKANLNYQMSHFPNGHILRADDSDITYRSPERMTYYLMWKLTGNQSYLDYLHTFVTAATGIVGWETANVSGKIVRTYIHGESVLDLVQYATASNDQSALGEARQRVAEYWLEGGNDYSNSSDSGKDYHQKLLGDDLSLWTATGNVQYRDESIRAYLDFVKFWDPNPPFGFWASLAKIQKTCFSRGYPSGVDMTPPIITAASEGQKITATIVDPNYNWLNMTQKGIGVNPDLAYLFYSLDGQTWSGNIKMAQAGNNTYTAVVPVGVAAANPHYLISASDYFNNTSTVEVTAPPFTATSTQTLSTVHSTSILTSVTTTGLGVSNLPPLGFGLAIAMAGAGAALAAGLGLALARRQGDLAYWVPQPTNTMKVWATPQPTYALPPAPTPTQCTLPCRYWRVCQHRHFPICSTNTRPYPVDDDRYYCHNCIARNFDWWYHNYGRYKKTVDVFETSYQSTP